MNKRIAGIFLFFALCLGIASAAAPSGTLPVMYINTDGGQQITSKTDYVKATYYLDPRGVEGVEAFGSVDAQLPLQIRGRGNYTWTGFDKKPYRLKLDAKTALMGMNKSKHWALLAHADDNHGYMRNACGFQLSRLIGLPWTPGDAAIEVVLNGDYLGLYFLTETVRVDKTRVNVYDYDSEVEDAEKAVKKAKTALTTAQAGGNADEIAQAQQALEEAQQAEAEARAAEPAWLVEIDNYDDPEQVKITESKPGLGAENRILRFTYDSPADYITEAHRQGLINEMTEIDRMIYDDDKENCRWADWVDLTDLAKFFIVNQLMDNYESFHGSCKLYRDNAAHGADTKWHFSPVWDFGSSFNRGNDCLFFQGSLWYNHWIEEMLKFPAFKAEVDRVYAEFMDGSYSDIYDYIENVSRHIAPAVKANNQRWPSYSYENANTDKHIAETANHLRNAVKFMNNYCNYQGGGDDPVNTGKMIYVRGSMNTWAATEAYRMKETAKGSGVYELEVTGFSGEFKIADAEWGEVNYGLTTVDKKVTVNEPILLLHTGFNIPVPADFTDGKLIFNLTDKTLTLSTGGDDPIHPGSGKVVYFIDRQDVPWSEVYVYTWKNGTQHLGSWPGKPMTLVNENELLPEPQNAAIRAIDPANPALGVYRCLWKYEFDESHDLDEAGLIFHNNKGEQTDDLTYMNDMVFDRDGNMITGLAEEIAASQFGIEVRDGAVYVTTDAPVQLAVYRLDGTVRIVELPTGVTRLELPRGFYIIAGKKVVL